MSYSTALPLQIVILSMLCITLYAPVRPKYQMTLVHPTVTNLQIRLHLPPILRQFSINF